MLKNKLFDTVPLSHPEYTGSLRGMGDVIKIVATPIAVVSDKLLGTHLVGCQGCAGRQKWLNEKVPFKK
jgi:hypothetical protein